MKHDRDSMPRFFKGWAKPGPILSREAVAEIDPDEGETLDAISGDFRLFQLKKGHRFSTDDVPTAFYGTCWCPRAETVLDLGSGVGSVGMIAAWRLPGARFVTIEAQQESVRLARKSARYNRIEERYEIRLGDFRDSTVLGENECFDLVRWEARLIFLSMRVSWAIIRRRSLVGSRCAATSMTTAASPSGI